MPTEEDRRRQPAGKVLGVVLVGLLFASLLNAHSLRDVALRQQPGAVRSVALALSDVAVGVSSTLRLDAPRNAIDRALGRDRIRSQDSVVAASPSSTPSAPVELDPTQDDPASAWIIGDSLVELFGPKLTDEFVASEIIEGEVDFRFITGLTRRELFDWPAHIRDRVGEDAPDIVVAMFGGNDGQPVVDDGTTLVEYTSGWWTMYRRRVADAMDAMRGVHVAYWIGLPIMKDADFRRHAREFNEVYREAAADRPWMRYVSSWEVFTDADGNYADYLPNHNGDLRRMRYADGAHFTPSGALKLALHVFDVIADDLDVPNYNDDQR